MIGGQFSDPQPVPANQQTPVGQPYGNRTDGRAKGCGGNSGEIVEDLFLLRRVS